MKAIVFDKVGLPTEVLTLANVPVPRIGDDEVLVKMVSASINPGDFLFVQNLYPEPKKPQFPGQIAGNHGAGVVAEAGRNVALKPGTLVAFSHYNTWAEYAAVPAAWLIALPDEYPVERAAQLVNPITAWDLVGESRVQAGQWLAVTAGYSSISTMVLQFAARRGIRVIPIVRRRHHGLDLTTLGAAATIDLSDLTGGLRERIMDITDRHGLQGIIDNVGGPETGELIRSLAFGGQVVINGGMSPDRFDLHNLDVLLAGAQIRGSVYRYFFTPPVEDDAAVLRKIIETFGEPDFHVPLGGIRSLDDFAAAIADAWHRPGLGKQLFRM
jgi:NADPH:quinone reductase